MGAKIGLFIPCYNVANSIGDVLASFSEDVLAQVDTILAIDNHSTDRTLEILKDFQRRDTTLAQKLAVIGNSENYGLGGSQKIAFRFFLDHGFSHFMIIHGDNQGDGDSIAKRFLDEHRQRPQIDLILASRFATGSNLRGYSSLRIAGNYFFNVLTFLTTGQRMSDAGTGIFFLRTAVLQRFPFRKLTNSFQFNPQLNVLFFEDRDIAKTMVPLDWRDSPDRSNINSIRYCLQLAKFLLRYGFAKYVLRKKADTSLYSVENCREAEYELCPRPQVEPSPRIDRSAATEKPWGKEVASTPELDDVVRREDDYGRA